MSFKSDSQELCLANGDKLHIKCFIPAEPKAKIIAIHGAMENGRIFYASNLKKGLAPWLARKGYEVWVPDLRGRGQSTPKISRHSTHDQTDLIVEDLVELFRFIESKRSELATGIVAHSWGGVIASAYMARFSQESFPSKVKCCVYFGTKRKVRVRTIEAFLKIHFFWKHLGPAMSKALGKLPAKALRIGAEDETTAYVQQSAKWVGETQWQDPKDNFDYGKSLQSFSHPPVFYLTGSKDKALGHFKDMCHFAKEVGATHSKTKLIGISQNYKKDYDHIDLLTDPVSETDHFLEVFEWLETWLNSNQLPKINGLPSNLQGFASEQ